MAWWQDAVFYQIYPLSFMDGNGDGFGDLDGIHARLDYLTDLGIDAVWLSPITPSPLADFGYDVADYTDIHPLFGDMDAFERLLAALHARGLRLILDFVPNHTSDEHPWFQASRASRDNPKHDWYIWRDPAPGGGPPNNWESFFGGPAWRWDAGREQYHLHLFLPQQPDLNWRNPQVRRAVHRAMRFWLDRGVDGFRMDVVSFLLKHPDLPDNPPLPAGARQPHAPVNRLKHVHDINQPELDGVFRDFRRTVDAYGDRVLLGETPEPDPALLGRFYGRRGDGLHLPFNFTLLDAPWEAPTLRRRLEDYYDALPAGATPNVVLGNHDCARLATRYGAANHRAAALLLLTLRGVPILYYGDELGMRNAPIPPERARDPWGLNNPDAGVGRDPARTPMQWDASPNAGFCPAEVEPWLPVAPEAHRVNVAVQRDDPASTLALYRRLLRLRRTWTALWEGRLDWVGQSPRDVLAYRREAGEQRLLVVINCGAEPQAWDASRLAPRAEVLLSTHAHPGGRVALEALALAPHQGLLLRLTGS